MNTLNEKSFSIGRYCVSPLIHLTPGGEFAAGVSIRSGSGRATHDRVFRFTPLFSSRESARRYAAREGASWVLSRR
jgi:hypothetical protein